MSHPRLGINAHQAGTAALHLAASLGVRLVRCDANWYDLQSGPDTWTWEWLDAFLATAREAQLTVYPTLSYSPAWLGLDRGDLPPLHDWIQFCETFARRYAGQLGQPMFVGCWNEFQGSASDYVTRLLRPMAEVFRRVDPRYKIVGPELELREGWPAWLRTVLREGGDCLDVLTVHSYEDTGRQVFDKLTKPRPWWQPWNDPSVLDVIQRAGYGHRPVWLTESGWRSDRIGEDQQAQQTDGLLERVLGDTRIAGVLIFQLMDESAAGGHGVFRMDRTLKPVGAVMQRRAGLSGR